MSSWKSKAIIATQGNRTPLGSVVCAMLGHLPNSHPRIRGLATIWDNGSLIVDFQRTKGGPWEAINLGHVRVVNDNMRRMCDAAGFSDEERIELFKEFQKWIERDLRAKSTLD